MSFQPVPSLVNFTPLTVISSADMDGNLSSLRNTLNNLIVSQDTLAPFTISGTLTIATGANISFKGGSGTVSGVTTFASGIAGTPNFTTGLSVSGIATFTSGWAISGGVVSGAVTFTSGITSTAVAITASALVAATVSLSATNALTTPTWTISTAGHVMPVSDAVYDVGASGTRTRFVIGAAMYASSFSFESTAQTQFNSNATNINVLVSGNLVAKFLATGSGVFLGEVQLSNRLKMVGADSIVLQSATLTTAATVGYVYMPTVPGTSSATPHAETGTVPFYVDTTNSRLFVFIGGTWKSVAVA